MPMSKNLCRKDHHVYMGREGISLWYAEVEVTMFVTRAWVRDQGLKIASKMHINNDLIHQN